MQLVQAGCKLQVSLHPAVPKPKVRFPLISLRAGNTEFGFFVSDRVACVCEQKITQVFWDFSTRLIAATGNCIVFEPSCQLSLSDHDCSLCGSIIILAGKSYKAQQTQMLALASLDNNYVFFIGGCDCFPPSASKRSHSLPDLLRCPACSNTRQRMGTEQVVRWDVKADSYSNVAPTPIALTVPVQCLNRIRFFATAASDLLVS
jgi:hypothetical protein